MERPVLRGQLVLDPDRVGPAAERCPRPPARPTRSHEAARSKASSAVTAGAAGAWSGRWSGRRRGGVGVATWRTRRKAKGRTTEVESANGQLVGPSIAPDPRRAWRPATLRPRRGARRAGEREVESATGQLPLPSTGTRS